MVDSGAHEHPGGGLGWAGCPILSRVGDEDVGGGGEASGL